MNCESDTCTLFMKHIIPAVGNVLALGIALSPMKSVLQVNSQKSLGSVNSLPFAFMATNALSWVIYSFRVNDYYIFAPNFLSFILALYYCLSTFAYSPEKVRQSITVVLLSGISLILFGGLLAFLVFGSSASTGRNIIGTISVFVLVLFYSSPLSNMLHVIQCKNAISIDPLLSVSCLLNAALWAVYGFVIADLYVWGPNALGVLTAIVQLILIGVFGRRPEEKTTEEVDVKQIRVVAVDTA